MSTVFLVVLLGAWVALFLPIILCIVIPLPSEALRPESVRPSTPQLPCPSAVQTAKHERPIPARTRHTAKADRQAA